jgi:hypothetical protein
MKANLLLAAMAFSAVLYGSAKPITPNQALSRFNSSRNVPAAVRAQKGAPMVMAETVKTSTGAAALYLYRTNNTMFILPADDSVTPLLGYVDVPAVDGAKPDQLQWLLGEYAREIAYLQAQANSADTDDDSDNSTTTADADDRDPIAPMVTAQWNQSTPYNNQCPIVDGSRSLTGCAATAAAQIMYYHKYPERGTGSISYSWDDDDYSASMNFEEQAFDWDNMLDRYTVGYTDEQADAVAYLMKACGHSMQMEYSPSVSNAMDVLSHYGLRTYFNYNSKSRLLQRNFYTLDDWENMLYENLSVVGPVFYTGNDLVSGHAFVCDGYASNGYFHFNWGWGGSYDGYFQLGALRPQGQGLGGNAGGFDFSQSAIFNLTAPGNATIEIAEVNPLILTGNLCAELSGTTLKIYSDALETEELTVYNYSPFESNFDIGLAVENPLTNEVVDVVVIAENREWDIYEGPYRMTITDIDEFDEGTYKMYLVSKSSNTPDDAWKPLTHKFYQTDYFYADFDAEGNLTAVHGMNANKLDVTNFTLDTSLYARARFKYSCTVSNNTDSEIYSGLRPVIYTTNDDGELVLVALGDAVSFDMYPGETQDVTLVSDMSMQNNDYSGDVYFGLVTTDNYDVINAIATVLHESTTTTLFASISYDGDATNVDPNDLTFKCRVSCSEGYFFDQFYVFIIDDDSLLQYFCTDDAYELTEGKSVEFTLSNQLRYYELGETYLAGLGFLRDNTAHLIAEIEFTVTSDDTTGLADNMANETADVITIAANRANGVIEVAAPSNIAAVETYAVDGRAFNLDAAINGSTATANFNRLPAGVSIVKVTLANGTCKSAKIVK